MSTPAAIKWLSKPEEHDYPAARSYLELLLEPSAVARLVQKLRRAPVASFKAKKTSSGLPDFHC